MQFNIWFSTVLFGLISTVLANDLDSLLNTLGLETFVISTTTSIPSLALSGVCSSTVISGSNSLGGYTATGFAVWESDTSLITPALSATHHYDVYWYFSYDNEINAQDFNFYGASDLFTDGIVFADLQKGAFLLQYTDSYITLLSIDILCLDTTFLFNFQADTTTLFDKYYIISLSGGSLNSGLAEVGCGLIEATLSDIYASCDVIDTQLCSPYGHGLAPDGSQNCEGTYPSTSSSSSIASASATGKCSGQGTGSGNAGSGSGSGSGECEESSSATGASSTASATGASGASSAASASATSGSGSGSGSVTSSAPSIITGPSGSSTSVEYVYVTTWINDCAAYSSFA